MLLMLEDDAERIQRFTEALHSLNPTLPLLVWRDAPTMIRKVGPLLPAALSWPAGAAGAWPRWTTTGPRSIGVAWSGDSSGGPGRVAVPADPGG